MSKPLQSLARSRLRMWLQSDGRSQTNVAASIGRNQEWVSRFLTGKLDADVDTLQQLAAIFGHSLASLLQVAVDPDEAKLIDAFRALSGPARVTAIEVVRAMAGRPPQRRGRARSDR